MKKAVIILAILIIGILAISIKDNSTQFQSGFQKTLSEDFEVDSFNDLITLGKFQKTQKVPSNNLIELTSSKSHSGSKSLKFTTFKTPGESLLKADIEKGNFRFEKGETVDFTGWYYIPSGFNAQELFLWDLEDPNLGSPVIRVWVSNDKISAEQKFPPREKIKQNSVELPRDMWFKLRIRLFLDESNGKIEIWQDNKKIIDKGTGTLAKSDSVYTRLQVGITAIKNIDSVVYVDDLSM